jgi:PleD family two-component response regulator
VDDLNSLVEKADKALYSVKHNGRNAVMIAANTLVV